MGGDLEKLKRSGQYLIEVWKAAGMNLDSVVFKWASGECYDASARVLADDVGRRKAFQIQNRTQNKPTASLPL